MNAVDYLRKLNKSTREELHYRLSSENFENGSKVISEGENCKEITFVIGGQLELFV